MGDVDGTFARRRRYSPLREWLLLVLGWTIVVLLCVFVIAAVVVCFVGMFLAVLVVAAWLRQMGVGGHP